MKVDLFLHILYGSNQNRTENTAKNIEISIFFTPSISIQNGVSVKLSNVMTSQQYQRGAQRFANKRSGEMISQGRFVC